MAFYKNQSGQKFPFALIDSDGDRVTGEAANITAQISKDGGSLAATNDTNPAELGTSGLYLFDATQAESNADFIYVEPSHATHTFDPPFLLIFTTPGANTGIHSDVRLWKGTAPANLADTDKIQASVQHDALSLSTFDPSTDKVTLADGVVHGGSTAKLRLGTTDSTPALYVTCTAADQYAVSVAGTGADARGLRVAAALSGQAFDVDGSFNVGMATGFGFLGQSDIRTALGLPTANLGTRLDTIGTNVSTLLTRIPAALFNGITSLASWLGALAGKTADAGTLAEIQATTAGAGYANADDSLQAIRDRGDNAWTGSGGGGGGTTITALATAVQSGEVSSTRLIAYEAGAKAWLFTVVDEDGNAIDLSGDTITLHVDKQNGDSLFTEVGTVSGDDNNLVTVTTDSTDNATPGTYKYALRNTSDDGEVLAHGVYLIEEAA